MSIQVHKVSSQAQSYNSSITSCVTLVRILVKVMVSGGSLCDAYTSLRESLAL